jgi:hypothetical protein
VPSGERCHLYAYDVGDPVHDPVVAVSDCPTRTVPETVGGLVDVGAAGRSGAGRSATSCPTEHAPCSVIVAFRSPVAPAVGRNWSAVSPRALGAAVPVVASLRVVIPVGGTIAVRPVKLNAASRSVPALVVVTDGATMPFELRVDRPAETSTGCAVSTPEYVRIEPTTPVDDVNVKVYALGSEAVATFTSTACVTEPVGWPQAVRTTLVQPVGVASAVVESRR